VQIKGSPPPGPLQNLILCPSLRTPQKLKKIILQGLLNKNSPWAHIESELSVFDVAGKLGENLTHACKKKLFFKESSPYKLPKRPKFGFIEF
jgi:hypothetical protein